MIQEILNRIAGQLQLSQPLQQELQTLFRGFPTDCDRGCICSANRRARC